MLERVKLARVVVGRHLGCMNEAIAALVRRHDPDRFLTALFAPPDRRDALLTLYAFNHELARAREAVSEPPLALIRLQWWREVVEGAHRRHEVAEPLLAAIDAGALQRGDLLPLIDAREAEVEPVFETLADWRGYVFRSAGGVAVAAGRLLGAPDPETLRPLGAAYGIAGLLRSIAVHSRQGRCLLPADILAEYGLMPEHVVAAAFRRAAGRAASCPRRIDVASTNSTAATGHCSRAARCSGEARSPASAGNSAPAWARRSGGCHVCLCCRPRLTPEG